MHTIKVQLSDAQLESLRGFSADFNRWCLTEDPSQDPLSEKPLPDELAILLCVMHTAVGPIHTNEVGACGLYGGEIGQDYPVLIEYASKWLESFKDKFFCTKYSTKQ